MKRIFLAGMLSAMILFSLSTCVSSEEETESSLVYGRVITADENAITVELGDYREGDFTGNGEEASYDLPESVFYDDFSEGDVVAMLLDGKTATVITNARAVTGEEQEIAEAASYSSAEAKLVADEADCVAGEEHYASEKNNEKCVLVKDGGTVTLSGVSLSSSFHNAQGLVVTGDGAKAATENIVINTSGSLSQGLLADASGEIAADQVTIHTAGANSAAVYAQKKGQILVSEGTLTAVGEDSPAAYSEGSVSLTGVTASAGEASGVVLQGSGSLSLKDSRLTASEEGVFFQSPQETGAKEESKFTATDAALSCGADSAMFRADEGKGKVSLFNTSLTVNSGVLAEIAADERNDRGESSRELSGGKLILSGNHQSFSGAIRCGTQGQVKLILQEESSFQGSIDQENTAGYSRIFLSKDSSWEVTADSHVTSIVNEKQDCSNITAQGYTVYYDGEREANRWLKGKTIELEGGGRLTPEP